MSNKCPNCTQPVLDSDTLCWHCGYRLTAVPTTAPPLPANPRPSDPKKAETAIGGAAPHPTPPAPLSTANYPLTTIGIYTLLTLVLILTMLWVMRTLGNRPLVMIHPGTRMGAEWTPVTAADEQFTLDLPVTWDWLAADSAQFAPLLDSGVWWETAVFPFTTQTDDLQYQLIAMPTPLTTPPDAYILITSSQHLRQVTPTDSLTLVSQNIQTATLISQNITERFTGQPDARFIIEIPLPDGSLRCAQHFVPAETAVYLITGCAPRNHFGTFSVILESILDSFQPLS